MWLAGVGQWRVGETSLDIGRRVVVTGLAGSGKSTLAVALAAKTGVPLIHLDLAFWKPGWVAPSEPEWRDKQRLVLAGDAWIADGNYHETLDLRIERAETVIVLDMPWWLCSLRALRRGFTMPGQLPEGCPYSAWARWRDEWRLAGRIWRDRQMEPAREREVIANHGQGVTVHVLTSRRAVSEFLDCVGGVDGQARASSSPGSTTVVGVRDAERVQGRIETERLVLRPIGSDDVGLLVALDSDAEVMRFLTGRPSTATEVEATIREHLGHRWIALDRASDAFVGWFGLVPVDDDTFELGYRLGRRWWGRGLATEGARAMLDEAFARRGASRVMAQTMTVNERSRSVMERCGMRLVRTFHVDFDDPLPGTEHGESEYELTVDDWHRGQP